MIFNSLDMPNIDKVANPTATKIGLKVGDTIKIAKPAEAAPSQTEGDTSAAPINTESENVETSTVEQSTVSESAEEDSLVSGSVKARKLGESRRKLASNLLDQATETDSGRANFKKLVEGDPDLDKYFRKHFPSKYSQALNEPASNVSVDEASIQQKTRMEMLSEQLKADKEESALDLAVKLKFSQSEADDLTELAIKLEGTKVGGKELDYEEALKRAARIIRPDKARVGITQLPAGFGEGSLSTDTKVEQRHEKIAESYRGLTGSRRSKDDIKKNLQKVESGYDEKQRKFVMPR